MSFTSYPKIWNLGHPNVVGIFKEEVTLEEKVDGSQFSFTRTKEGELICSSKSVSPPDKMFDLAVAAVSELDLIPGWVYRGEYLKSPKHNTLAYDRIPVKHVVLFDVMTGHEDYLSYDLKAAEAARLGLEVVPVYYRGRVEDLNTFENLLGKVSFLGGAKVEGVVIKSPLFGRDSKPLFAKYVSEEFRELHKANPDWKRNTGADIKLIIADKICTPARWAKAVQHLSEKGLLQNAPQDIGPLMKEAHLDIEGECLEQIKEELLKWALPEIKRAACRGLPEWYKEQLLKRQFND